MRPISARIGVVARFVMPGLARFILHNKDGARKHFFDTELRGLLEARQIRASGQSQASQIRTKSGEK